ncbi:tetratricopeptide repeat protein [Candidatus Aminicenantes bacterium AC-708-M15]|jgi:tetratricopeptide (TPR) repeat protein|nr:tetratricopeptide repeat protein [SCandidatus Aminicenantes bacterium Aminicenantia_JdfR_composite]MCP2597071.1 tetratricopeptide repeat protein [Candidatus Aminicenantes bacterium AC-335-G13]MCP2598752.1 tetratricopeptide repeat protein [Candidatus Aminicenantes bacterium AC-335-L06]MCP2598999.1 tetratricopeptide repeat protein [Candidatus Aminicenantes bacterium AC-335-B20]MCP2604181.1 tetratricopeptide repeat protein [Candidatus Aminicenantes bacterium AC-708-M15]MCP2605478.1 tetratricop
MKKVIFFSFLFLLISNFLLASIHGKILGKVTDKKGNPLKDVKVKIISTKTLSVHFEVKTDKKGNYMQVGIYPGYYIIQFEKKGYLTVTKEVKVSIGESTRVNVKMESADEYVSKKLSPANKAFLEGNKYFNQNKFDEAIEKYKRAIELGAGQENYLFLYYFNLGLAYKKINKIQEAINSFLKCVELNPESYSSYKNLGELFAKNNDYEKAKFYFEKAIELSPEDPVALYNLSVSYINTGQSNKAWEILQKVISLDPDFEDAYYYLGTLSISRNEKEKAISYLEKFLELASEDNPNTKIANQLLNYLKKKNP